MAVLKDGTGVVKKKQMISEKKHRRTGMQEGSSELSKAAERYAQRMQNNIVEERECWALLEMHRL